MNEMSLEEQFAILDLTHAEAAREFRKIVYGDPPIDMNAAAPYLARAMDTCPRDDPAALRQWLKIANAVLKGTFRTRVARIESIDGVDDELQAAVEAVFEAMNPEED